MRAAAPRLARALLLILGLAACQSSSAAFDYYVLALSWSPEYCASDAAKPGSKQCSQPREFIVHGLWPQYERGYPEFCDTQTRVPERTADKLAPLMPDRGLVFYQWKKHGSCSGLSPDAYFSQLERAGRAIKIPSAYLKQAARKRVKRVELERAFIESNPQLRPEAISFECSRQYLREVRVCLDRELRPRACGADVNERCGKELSVRPSGK